MSKMPTTDKQITLQDFGPHRHGAKLHIDAAALFDPTKPVAVDVETDEEDGFVGIGMCQSDTDVYYWSRSEWGPELKDFVASFKYIMHNGAFDIVMLKKWGVNVTYDKLAYDTSVLAYTNDTTEKSYGLKALAKKYLNVEWPTYKEMVQTGKKKTTLNKQPVERVARYCGMDTLITYKLYQYMVKRMSSKQLCYFFGIELPIYKLLTKMSDRGVYLDVPYLTKLDKEFKVKMEGYETELKDYGEFNPRSPKQLLKFLHRCGYDVKNTSTEELEGHKKNPVIQLLLNYRKYKKLHSTYTQPFLSAPTLPRLHGRFYQNTITGRLSSSGPNLQNIPAPDPEKKRFHDDVGTKIRRVFTASPGKKLFVADYSQIEYRLFAHFTADPVLLEVYKKGEDVHQKTADLVGGSRRVGKTLNFAAIYGAHAKKIAQTAGISEKEAEEMLNTYWDRLKLAAAWVAKTKWQAHKNGGVSTLLGRFIPLPRLESKDKFERFHAERVAINAVIQGSAAELIKQAMLRINNQLGLVPLLQVHDELVYELDEEAFTGGGIAHEIVAYMVEPDVEFRVPLDVSAEIGSSWADCKS